MSDFIVEEGDWEKIQRYRGSSLFRAGLAAARTRRDLRGWLMGGVSNSAVSVYDMDGLDIDTDGLSDEQREFFERCVEAGERRYGSEFAKRRRQAARDRIAFRSRGAA